MKNIKWILITLLLSIPIKAVAKNVTFKQLASVETGAVVQGAHFNDDGKKLFIVYRNKTVDETFVEVREFSLSKAFDVSTLSDNGDAEVCVLNDGSSDSLGPINSVFDIEFSNDGLKLFVGRGASTSNNREHQDKVFRFDLTSPYDVSTCTFANNTSELDHDDNTNGTLAGNRTVSNTGMQHNRLQGFELSNDGKKLFTLFHGQGSEKPRLIEYDLSTAFDLSTMSKVTTAGIALDETAVTNPMGMRFSPDGKRFWITSHTDNSQNVAQFSLDRAFDTSSYNEDGNYDIQSIVTQPRGIAFSKNGLKMYVGSDADQGGEDQIYEFDLACPFNIISGKCPPITENKDRSGIAEAQIEMAKRTIEYSTDSALNRLKWIRRNKERQNLTNHNINFDFLNPKIAKFTKKISSLNTKEKKTDNKQDIFYWSEGSIAVGKVGDTSISSAKNIDTNSITFGADKFTENNGIKGFAFRLGKDDVDVGSAGSNLDTDTFNLTYYSTSQIDDDTKLLDTIFGIGRLNSDILTVIDGQNLSADRSGNQLYGAFKIKDEIKNGKFTLVPSGQFDFGHTILSAYKETGLGAIKSEDQHVRTRKLRTAMAMIQDLSKDNYTFKTHSKLEYLADLERTSNFKYTYLSDESLSYAENLNAGALHNLNGEIGLDFVMPNSFSLFLIYERKQALEEGYTDKIHVALGYLPNKNTNYAFTVDAKDNLRSKVLVSRKIGDYKLSFDHSHDFLSEEDNYLSSINLSKDF